MRREVITAGPPSPGGGMEEGWRDGGGMEEGWRRLFLFQNTVAHSRRDAAFFTTCSRSSVCHLAAEA